MLETCPIFIDVTTFKCHQNRSPDCLTGVRGFPKRKKKLCYSVNKYLFKFFNENWSFTGFRLTVFEVNTWPRKATNSPICMLHIENPICMFQTVGRADWIIGTAVLSWGLVVPYLKNRKSWFGLAICTFCRHVVQVKSIT